MKVAESDNYLPVFLNFSAQTNSNRTQEMIESKLEKKRKNILGQWPLRGRLTRHFLPRSVDGSNVNYLFNSFYELWSFIEVCSSRSDIYMIKYGSDVNYLFNSFYELWSFIEVCSSRSDIYMIKYGSDVNYLFNLFYEYLLTFPLAFPIM